MQLTIAMLSYVVDTPSKVPIPVMVGILNCKPPSHTWFFGPTYMFIAKIVSCMFKIAYLLPCCSGQSSDA